MRFRATHRKTLGDAEIPAETSERISGVPREGPRLTIVLTHGAGPCLMGRRHLHSSAPHQASRSRLRR
jgi:hypothetical protein